MGRDTFCRPVPSSVKRPGKPGLFANPELAPCRPVSFNYLPFVSRNVSSLVYRPHPWATAFSDVVSCA